MFDNDVVPHFRRLFHWLRFLFELNEDLHVIFDKLCGQTQRILRADRTIRPDLDRQLIVVRYLPQARSLDPVIDLPNR